MYLKLLKMFPLEKTTIGVVTIVIIGHKMSLDVLDANSLSTLFVDAKVNLFYINNNL